MPRERTFVLLKPDAIQRSLVGGILARFEQRGLKLVALKLVKVPRELAETYYLEHKGKPFYAGLVKYVTSSPSVALVLEGDEAVAVVRKMMGKTNSAEAESGTIRGDFGIKIGRNLIHGSDSVATAKREIGLFFKPEELLDYARIDETWLYE